MFPLSFLIYHFLSNANASCYLFFLSNAYIYFYFYFLFTLLRSIIGSKCSRGCWSFPFCDLPSDNSRNVDAIVDSKANEQELEKELRDTSILFCDYFFCDFFYDSRNGTNGVEYAASSVLSRSCFGPTEILHSRCSRNSFLFIFCSLLKSIGRI
jgi:hypothetical protein